MSGDAEQLKAQLLEWLRACVGEGWIAGEEIDSLADLEARGAARLFEPGGGRPLTIGLFGGTGVGKSSLLNRLVGEPVAEVGLERPTSTRVTLYVHERYPVRDLAELFPVERVRILEHRRDEYRDVVWIDMPDIDSVERDNRELVLEWLPFIDWLVYVVSPERYRDDAGWRLLKERSHRHHWLFVMNRWDTGTAEQYQDFGRMLRAEGFDESPLLRTSCTQPEGDDFEGIVETVSRAVSEHGLERLQEVGERARLADLARRCQRYRALLGGGPQWRAFIDRGCSVIEDKAGALSGYLRDEAALEAQRVPDRPPGGDAPAVQEPTLPALVPDYVRDIDAAVVVSLGDLPAGPVMERTRGILDSFDQRVASAFRRGFRDGAAQPGNAVQRAGAGLMARLVYGLPLLACIGIAYVVVTRYREGLGGEGEFLGFDFLTHSLMMLGLAALVPYLLGRLLRPSVRRSIVGCVARRLRELNAEVVGEWTAAMEELHGRSRELQRSLDAIQAGIERASKD